MARPRADDVVRVQVTVIAPTEVAAAVTSGVDLIRWQDFAEMTEDLFDRLAAQAVSQAAEAAATQGYFSAQVDVAVDRSVQPVEVTLTVTPGLQTTISDVRINVTGAATATVGGHAVIARLREAWLLPRGDAFNQRTWTGAKDASVATLAANAYAAARMTESEARVDPEARSAELSVSLESGPAFHFGRFDFRGLHRYSSEMVANFSSIEPGSLYNEQVLDDFVRRLLASGYFASVQATIDADPAQAEAATVTFAFIEAPTRRLEAGIGYSTDTQYRLSANYVNLDTFGSALQFHADARIESKIQQASVRFARPPTAGGWIDSFGMQLTGTDIENLLTKTASITARRSGLNERRTPAFGVGFYVDEQTPSGYDTQRSHALYVDGEYTWRNADSLLEPTRGWMANVKVGVGLPGVSTEQFGRVIGRAVAWYPLSKSNSVSARFEVGAVIADSREGIPSNFLFRTGGDTTVRGYAFESLGVQQGAAVVGGRYLAVASIEAVHWVTPAWGIAAFVDAGNAGDTVSDLDPALGYGMGARLRTPIGPFRLDLAYGQESKSVRVHFSVGLAF